MKKLLSILILSLFTTGVFAQLKITQVYGGGGSATGTFKQDFVELFNAGSSPASLNGLSIQYASSGGTFTSICILPNVSVPVGSYYLVQMSTGTGIGNITPDFTSPASIAMSGTNGKIVLVTGTTTAGSCPATGAYIDKVSYGTNTTVCAEGTTVGTLSATTSATRTISCVDTDNNSADFTIGTPVPRNLSTSPAPCSGGGSPTLTATPGAFSNIAVVLGSPSAEFTYSITGANLTAGPIVVTPSSNLEISTTTGGPYTSSAINLTYTAPTLAATSVYARVKNTAPAGTFSESITNVGGGATTTVTATGLVAAAEPTVQATNVLISGVTNTGFTFSWTNGDGASRIAVIRGSASEVAPADGTGYTANTAFGLGSTTGTGNYVVYNGTGSGPVTVTGLTAGTTYTVKVYEYNGSTTSANYLTAASTGNPASQLTTGTAPVTTIVQQDFIGVSVPLYMAAGSSTNRVPAMFYATVRNLIPNTIYRYFTAAAGVADIGTVNTAGLPVLIEYNNGNAFSIPSSASISATTASGNFGTFTTNASGSFSGGFGIVPSTNARFNAGSTVYPVLCLGVDNGTATTVQQRLALDQTFTALPFGTTATDGTFIKGASSATPKNLIALWQSVDGSSFVQATARPQAMTFAENAGATTTVIAGYDNTAGAWNTIIPNNNANGIQLIQQLDLVSGATVGCTSDADGLWPSGANTVSPAGGVTPIVITSTDAPLTAGACFSVLAVNLTNFTAAKKGNAVQLNWATAQEVNSNRFEVLRSADGVNWKLITSVTAAGNSNTTLNYAAMDNAPLSGKNLYRLRSIDNDGKATLSDIRTVIFSDKFEILVSPNLVKDVININISKQGNAPVQIALINSTGAVVRKYTTNSTFYSISAAGLNKGLYIVKIVSEDASATEKIIVQ